MYFIDKRIQVICDNLNKLRIRNVRPITDWQYKKGFFLYPSQAEVEGDPWEAFDGKTMHWYGPDEHYWFRGSLTIPEDLAGKSVWLKVRTQIEEWDDGKNPQFLLFINGRETQGLDMNHREVQLFPKAPAGESFSWISRRTPALSTRSFSSWWNSMSRTRRSTGCTGISRSPSGRSPG